ncbi:MAG: TIGR04283 family arsenosugar biosynthesis glycosyltransferase [Magnetococcus sp. XQGC-1]
MDGGSHDDSVAQAEAWGACVLHAPRGRACQMNAGAAVAHGDLLLFLHADTWLPPSFHTDELVADLTRSGRVWGRFAVTIQGRAWLLRVVGWMMNFRSCLTGIATGDQAIFVLRHSFIQAGGFPEQPLMEDIALSKRLLAISPPLCLQERVTTSGRRWEVGGVWRTIFLMWQLRWAYWLGVPADALAARYPDARAKRV